MTTKDTDREALLSRVLELATRYGATSADALFSEGRSTEIRVRLGTTEMVKQSRNKGLGLRVFCGQSSATTSTSDLDAEALDALVRRTCEAAQVTAKDGHAGLPAEAAFNDAIATDLELFDARIESLTIADAIDMTRACESASLDADPRISNSEGAEMSWGIGDTYFANTWGTQRHKRTSSVGLWTAPVAETPEGKERDYWYTSARHLEDLSEPGAVGAEAARRALRRLGAQKPATCEVPVIYESPVASRLLGALAGALTGGAIYREASYLAGQLGEVIAHPSVTIHDDARIPRGASSRPYDGEGLATRRTAVVEQGVLSSYLLDTYSARKLGLKSTRNAARSLGGSPGASPTNFWMTPGAQTLEELIAEVDNGLLVTELIGFGINTVTGDYSQGAVGIWIENGELTYPVSELTVASKLPEMWRTIDGIGSDLDRRRSVSAPSIRIARMTVGGT